MNDLIKWFFLGLRPPDMPTGKEATEEMRCRYIKYNHRWKHAICYVVWGIMIAGTLFFFWARGELTYIGPGFAYAADVDRKASDLNIKIDSVVTSLNRLVVNQLRNDLRETRRLMCRARSEKNEEMLRRYSEDLEGLEEQYFVSTNRVWTRPACEDV